MTTINAHDYTSGEVLTAATMDGVTADLNTLLTEVEGSCYIETGTYTGDGTEDQTITLTDTEMVTMAIWIWVEVADTQTTATWSSSDDFCDNDADGLFYEVRDGDVNDNRLLSMGTGNFHVDDDGANLHPNTDGTTYHYIVFGTH